MSLRGRRLLIAAGVVLAAVGVALALSWQSLLGGEWVHGAPSAIASLQYVTDDRDVIDLTSRKEREEVYGVLRDVLLNPSEPFVGSQAFKPHPGHISLETPGFTPALLVTFKKNRCFARFDVGDHWYYIDRPLRVDRALIYRTQDDRLVCLLEVDGGRNWIEVGKAGVLSRVPKLKMGG